VTSPPWSRVAPIVEAALLCEAQTRAAFVAQACGNDAGLAREVESLLALTSEDADFLSTPALALARAVWSESPRAGQPTFAGLNQILSGALRLAVGQRVGQYRIERLVGRGGMGEVYEAEHLEHGRRVALKVLSRGFGDAMDRARFLREGQLAAAVNHPHVVYIYGSEDIAGMPAIAMELLPGGTLKERLEKEGPLAPMDAVDSILQVVSGLEAAYHAGVLHRDVKPSNCFVDADGTVKVGDFGLAIPSLELMQLTATGTIQATPQFASPEQLHGQPLDIRSDIYAVGGTLYCLLTGRPPFEDRDVAALVSRVATEVPASPCEGRPEVPQGLAAVVLQCLAKSPVHRPAGYRALAKLLAPFGSTAAIPAPMGTRAAAYAFDTFFGILLPLNVMLGTFVALERPSSVFDAKPLMATFVAVSYFAIAEGFWGSTLGKWLCGLRVVSESGAPPRFGQALLRALVFVVPAWLAAGLVTWIAGLAYSMQGRSAITTTVVIFVVRALLFVTARRANGFAGIHERASRTRTVSRPAVARHGLVPAFRPIEAPTGSRCVGPYRVVETSDSQPHGDATLGYDDRLQRTVWLRFSALEAEPVPHVRRDVRRSTRPRWLAGQRGSGLAWDAYDYVPGRSFLTVVTRAQSWDTVRGWLCDLAEEVQAGLRDGSLGGLELDRVWIGRDDRAWLLDWEASTNRLLRGTLPARQVIDLPRAERFLYRLAASALEGHLVADTHPHLRASQVRLPMAAAECLAALAEQRFTTAEDMLTAVRSAARGPAAVFRTKRAVHLSLCAVVPMLMLIIGVLTVYHVGPPFETTRARIGSVRAGEAADRAGIEPGDVIVAVEGEPIALASQLRDTIAAHPDQPITLSILRDGLPLHIRATPTRRADHGQLGIVLANETSEASRGVTWRYLWLQVMAGLIVAGVLGLLSALAVRGGIALRLMNVAIVQRNGTLASGSRTRLRAFLSWLPVMAASAAALVGHSPLLALAPQAAPVLVISSLGVPVFFPAEPSFLVVRLATITVALAVFVLAVILALMKPERGLQDRLAGTWLVPG